ncbi:dTMP kinase [Fastidiosipila sanguinis]|uniref:Thymidylate kinase n=1 Tax=Fastidiosipila sanguinis TaxID=236753 RepID=A0A2S0KPD7_9FIRM|nr:dTMP kinase [Fastidiosipila sanguinis]AVM42895.1 dTMP kinase [Fastidiosipila sanguinis]
MKKGLFITIEGGDGVGKGTQVKFIQEYLLSQNIDYISLREPGGSRIGEAIREILLDKDNLNMTAEAELLLFNAGRAQLVEELVKPTIAKGTWVISDRFYDSSIAYQVGGRGLNERQAREIIEFACQGLEPDVTIYLDLSVDEAIKRREKREIETNTSEDRMELESTNFARRVRDKYLEIAASEPRVKTVDAGGSIQEVSSKIKEILDELIKDFRGGKL